MAWMQGKSSMDIAARIQKRLNELNLTANAASLRAGLPRDAVRDILTGKSQNPRGDTIMKISIALETDPAYLLIGRPPTMYPGTDQDEDVFLPIKHTVAAGAWREIEDYGYDVPVETRPVARLMKFAYFDQWLERVQGDSMDRMIPPGSFVHVVDAIQMHYEARDKDVVVVERKRAQGALFERSLKQLASSPSGFQLWPRSHNPKWDKPLALADQADTGDDMKVQIVGLVIRAYIDFQVH